MTKADLEELRSLIEQTLVYARDAADDAAEIKKVAAPTSDEVKWRAEFWSLPPEALTDRRTAAAALYLSMQSMELFATKGTGPRYLRIGRKVYYRKADVLAWIEKNGRTGTSTAELEGP